MDQPKICEDFIPGLSRQDKARGMPISCCWVSQLLGEVLKGSKQGVEEGRTQSIREDQVTNTIRREEP